MVFFSYIAKPPNPENWTLVPQKVVISQKKDNTEVNISLIHIKLMILSRVIFDVRMNADGSVNKYKARLVAQGNHQDTSFFDTFADTASARSIIILLCLAASENMEILTVDIKTAF